MRKCVVTIWAALMVAAVIGPASAQTKTLFQREFDPPGGKGRPVVFISGHAGPNNYLKLAADLAGHGFFIVLVDSNELWVKEGGDPLLRDLLKRVQASPKAIPGKVGVVGSSLGGGVALAFATRMPDLVAGIVTTYPYTTFIKDVDGLVARTKVPTLILAAGRDTYQSCCLIDMARNIAAASKNKQSPPMFELVEYPHAQHGFNLPGQASRTDDAADAMDRTVKYLRKAFGDPPPKSS
jgi:pimeloyl-ACP methyl ester carboxylesterase